MAYQVEAIPLIRKLLEERWIEPRDVERQLYNDVINAESNADFIRRLEEYYVDDYGTPEGKYIKLMDDFYFAPSSYGPYRPSYEDWIRDGCKNFYYYEDQMPSDIDNSE